MKANLKIFILFIAFVAGTWIAPQKTTAQVSVSFQVFYDDLSPYGNWVDYPNYGYVWIPNAGPDFRPYGTNGHWVFTNYGWTWVSDYPWGWAPFHYGRWQYDPYYGNLWVPGNEWGPGWVSWRQSEGYYGWAPIGPGISIDVAYSSGYYVPNDRWIFVGSGDFGRSNINSYYVDRSNNATIINNTTVINNVQSDQATNTRYNAGPDRGQVQSRTGNAISPVALKESNKPGQSMSNGEIQMYKPRVEKNGTAGQKAAPSKVSNLKDIKPVAERKGNAQPQKAEKPNKEQPAKQQPAQQQQKKVPNKEQPSKQAPVQQQQKSQPDKQAPKQEQQQKNQTNKEQPSHQQPEKKQAPQQQKSQPEKQQPAQQQPSQQNHNAQPAKQQPAKQQPAKQQPSKQKSSDQQAKPQQQQEAQPKQNNKEGKQPK